MRGEHDDEDRHAQQEKGERTGDGEPSARADKRYSIVRRGVAA